MPVAARDASAVLVEMQPVEARGRPGRGQERSREDPFPDRSRLPFGPQPRGRRYRIFRTDTGYRVAGRPPGDEELAEALKAAGAKKGDEVEIEGEPVELG